MDVFPTPHICALQMGIIRVLNFVWVLLRMLKTFSSPGAYVMVGLVSPSLPLLVHCLLDKLWVLSGLKTNCLTVLCLMIIQLS